LDGLQTEQLLQNLAEHEATPAEDEGAEGSSEIETPAVEVDDSAARERLSQRVSEFLADFSEVREGVGREQGLFRSLVHRLQERMTQLDAAIAQEQSKIDKVEALASMRTDLLAKNEERERYTEQCDLAGELLQGAMREVSFKFNQKIRGLVSKTLPLFTEQRYEHLQIGEDLTVRAFSSEKRDFMDLEEISSGTQRQIMLAVRLALSQELVERAVKSSQFLFLDEPFAFFDQARTRSSLKVLPTLSEQLDQIWIIGQEFPEDLEFDRHIKCDREFNTIG
jgi:exonuclease SbcC